MALSGKGGVEVLTGPVEAKINEIMARTSTAGVIASFSLIHTHFLRKTEAMFDQLKDPSGSRWAPHAPITPEIRENLGFSPEPINDRSGKLRDELTTAPMDILGHSDGVVSYAFPYRRWPDSDIMKRMVQAQVGGGSRSPARKVVGMNASDVAFVITTLNSAMFKGL